MTIKTQYVLELTTLEAQTICHGLFEGVLTHPKPELYGTHEIDAAKAVISALEATGLRPSISAEEREEINK